MKNLQAGTIATTRDQVTFYQVATSVGPQTFRTLGVALMRRKRGAQVTRKTINVATGETTYTELAL